MSALTTDISETATTLTAVASKLDPDPDLVSRTGSLAASHVVAVSLRKAQGERGGTAGGVAGGEGGGESGGGMEEQ